MAPNPAQTCFRQSLSFHFSTEQLFFPDCFSADKKIGHIFCQDLEEMTIFGHLQQISEGFLFRIHLLLGLYGSWSRKYDPGIADQGTDAAQRARMQRGGHMGQAH